jgi:outer membrane protein OmpA-like peptidoglycan-associated protein
VKADKIEINEKIQFMLNSAAIKPESFSLMDEISKVIADHPEIAELGIEGHASSEGSGPINMTLSDKRAKSVMDYIVKKGVNAKRLTAKGFGSTKPIADNATEEGRVANRRVEFNIIKRDAAAAAAPAPAKDAAAAPAPAKDAAAAPTK